MVPLTPRLVSSASVALPVAVVDALVDAAAVVVADDAAVPPAVLLVAPVDELVEEIVVILPRTADCQAL